MFCQYNNAEELVVYDKNYRKTGELKPKSKTSNIEDTRLHVKDLEPIISFRWSEHQQAVRILVNVGRSARWKIFDFVGQEGEFQVWVDAGL